MTDEEVKQLDLIKYDIVYSLADVIDKMWQEEFPYWISFHKTADEATSVEHSVWTYDQLKVVVDTIIDREILISESRDKLPDMLRAIRSTAAARRAKRHRRKFGLRVVKSKGKL